MIFNKKQRQKAKAQMAETIEYSKNMLSKNIF